MTQYAHQYRIIIPDLPALNQFAENLANQLRPGDLVSLDGQLGAGKTTLVQALGQALHLKETVSSPTFVLMNEYLSGPFPIAHVDLYRLGEDRAVGFANELYAMLDEGRSLILVEWACYGEFLQDDITIAVQVDFAPDLQKKATPDETWPDETSSPMPRRITLSATRPLDLSPVN